MTSLVFKARMRFRVGTVAGAVAASTASVEAHGSGAEQPDKADHDQVDGDDEVQQPGHDQDENPRDEGDEWRQAEMKVHGFPMDESGTRGARAFMVPRRLGADCSLANANHAARAF
jgi:hypothetical protein